MTILADSAYLKSDYGKIKNNTYRKRDKDFTGSVLYHRLDGSFVNGWRYINGAITGVINQIPVATSATRSLIHVSKQPKTATVACTTWLVTTYWEDCAYYSNDYSYANPFDCFSYTTESIFTSCSSVSSGGGTGSTSPPPCQVPTSAGTAVTASATKTLTRQVAPTGGGTVTGGIVDPTTQIGTTATPCVTVAPVDTTKNPCAHLAQLNSLSTNSTIVDQNTQLAGYLTTSNLEHGFDQNLQSLTSMNGIYFPTSVLVAPSSNPDGLNPPFNWDSNSGYTIGFSHNHPNGTGPSPADIFSMLNNSKDPRLTSANVSFYKANASVTVVTKDNNYVVTINNWAAVQAIYNTYLANPTAFDNNVINNTSTANYEAAILTAFQGAINLYSNNGTPNAYYPISLNSSNQVAEVPCPTN